MYYMANSLARHAGEVVPLGPVESARRIKLRTLSTRMRPWLGKRYDAGHSVFVSMEYGQAFQARLRASSVDVIFAPSAATEIAYLSTTVPIVYLSDATFAAISGYYEDFSNLLGVSLLEGNLLERRAIRKATRIVYASDWARLSALRDYAADPSRIHVIPFGANLDGLPSPGAVVPRRRAETLRLLFVGVDWERKGGPIAIEAFQALSRLGVPVSLTVVGCQPSAIGDVKGLRIVPYLNKNDPDQLRQLTDLYRDSDVFFLPTRAECSGIAFCEAAAWGLPIVSTDTGGVGTVVQNGKTGVLLAPEADGRSYAEAIANLWADGERYANMASAGREDFEKRLNWDAWGESAGRVLREAVAISA